MNSTLSSEQETALVAFANRNGRTWKSKLRDIWMTGHYSSDDNSVSLQQVRNQFGAIMASKLQTSQMRRRGHYEKRHPNL